MSQSLPLELRQLVRLMTAYLGETIEEFEGKSALNKVESYRQSLKALRKTNNYKALQELLDSLRKENPEDQLKIAHGFSLLMELINVCETAYRTWRLQSLNPLEEHKKKIHLNYVLTSHPTEARSPKVVSVLGEISDLLIESLQTKSHYDGIAIKSKIRLLWQIPLSKSQKPKVQDEADFIFSLVLKESSLYFILGEKPSYNLKLRTWVGGDKDGHPGVNEKVMVDCLKLSRVRIIRFLVNQIERTQKDLRRVGEGKDLFSGLKKELLTLRLISPGDGGRVKRAEKKLNQIITKSGPYVKGHEGMIQSLRLFDKFPGLVLPIELREDSGVIKENLNSRGAIAKMLESLFRIARGGKVTDYAKGIVISHCENIEDIKNTQALLDKYLRSDILPVIPLFETRSALKNGSQVIDTWLKSKEQKKRVKDKWENKLEIMLGYSDSSKETGVLASRRLIQISMNEIQDVLVNHEVIPIFFHGSGGSVARGGGSLKEQIKWWPNGAIDHPKMTLQGEMIQRVFASKEILNSQARLMSAEARNRGPRGLIFKKSAALNHLLKGTESAYRELVSDNQKLQTLLSATPFDYLDVLKIGSRPSKRKKEFSLSSLRAIPWVLCWTQTRLLLPTWWGLGRTWKNLSEAEKQQLKNLFKNDSFFSSFVKTVGFTLAKVNLDIWQCYLHRVAPEDQNQIMKELKQELKLAKSFVLEVTGEKDLIWYRPWLQESIHIRSPYVHILNLLQIIAMDRKDEKLLCKTIVGIASGMLTTG